ncbi:DAK2 domain-containing protein [Phytohabitans sp. ZYX-F-186]|uniref:DAK2 domain-containing protein n=1 Tax=Phytohabitans maris TaxID=3071409 RepID=A0ABU0ZXQ9_9ACTN|nr:DAK2 domain-containing protein [Phytohabitans sp. ZYX-F-186]MDQ7911297.1 DAK2 domain-containing protein [Phytohabitans sp. ZYX-F-186]
MLIGLYLAAAEAAHARLTEYDQAAGDGDFGDNLRDGLRGAHARIPDGADLATETETAATYFLDEVGGTSGPLIGLLLRSVASAAAASPSDVDAAVVRGLTEGTAAIQRVGEARVGDRTLVDCLAPTLDGLRGTAGPIDWTAAATAALAHARATADLTPRMGRASYIGKRALGTPDAGAIGVALFFWALALYRDPASRDALPDPAAL